MKNADQPYKTILDRWRHLKESVTIYTSMKENQQYYQDLQTRYRQIQEHFETTTQLKNVGDLFAKSNLLESYSPPGELKIVGKSIRDL